MLAGTEDDAQRPRSAARQDAKTAAALTRSGDLGACVQSADVPYSNRLVLIGFARLKTLYARWLCWSVDDTSLCYRSTA